MHFCDIIIALLLRFRILPFKVLNLFVVQMKIHFTSELEKKIVKGHTYRLIALVLSLSLNTIV